MQCAVLFLVLPLVNAAVVCTYIYQPLIIIAFTFSLVAIFFIIAKTNFFSYASGSTLHPRKLVWNWRSFEDCELVIIAFTVSFVAIIII